MLYAYVLVALVDNAIIRHYASIMKMSVDIALVASQVYWMHWNVRQYTFIKVMTAANVIKILQVIIQLKNIMITFYQNLAAI